MRLYLKGSEEVLYFDTKFLSSDFEICFYMSDHYSRGLLVERLLGQGMAYKMEDEF